MKPHSHDHNLSLKHNSQRSQHKYIFQLVIQPLSTQLTLTILVHSLSSFFLPFLLLSSFFFITLLSTSLSASFSRIHWREQRLLLLLCLQIAIQRPETIDVPLPSIPYPSSATPSHLVNLLLLLISSLPLPPSLLIFLISSSLSFLLFTWSSLFLLITRSSSECSITHLLQWANPVHSRFTLSPLKPYSIVNLIVQYLSIPSHFSCRSLKAAE